MGKHTFTYRPQPPQVEGRCPNTEGFYRVFELQLWCLRTQALYIERRAHKAANVHEVLMDAVCSFFLLLVDGLLFCFVFLQAECSACNAAVRKVTVILWQNDVDSIRHFYKLCCRSSGNKLQMGH